MSLQSNKTFEVAAGLLLSSYNMTVDKLRRGTLLALNANVSSFMADLRATYPQFEFDFYGEHIAVYHRDYPSDDHCTPEMTVSHNTRVDSDTEVGMRVEMVRFLAAMDRLINAMDGIDIILTHNLTPRYAL